MDQLVQLLIELIRQSNVTNAAIFHDSTWKNGKRFNVECKQSMNKYLV